MTDLFISYSRRDRSVVEQLAAALERAGWSVWWDHHIGAGDAFDRRIEQAIQQSRLVIVVWSQRSVASDWVRAEASYALESNKLIPILLDDATLPLRFINTHTLSFGGWDGSSEAAVFQKLVDEIAELLASDQPRAPISAATPPTIKSAPASSGPATPAAGASAAAMRPARSRTTMMAAAGGAVALVAAIGIGSAVLLHGPAPPAAGVANGGAPTPPAVVVKAVEQQPTSSGLGEPIYFEKGTTVLSASARSALDRQGTFLSAHPAMAVRIESYSRQGEGSPATLRGLAELRAYAVRRELTQQGVDATRLSIAVHVDDSAPSAGDISQAHGPRVVLVAAGG